MGRESFLKTTPDRFSDPQAWLAYLWTVFPEGHSSQGTSMRPCGQRFLLPLDRFRVLVAFKKLARALGACVSA